ncbi:MAG: hemolysin III family protein [Chlorobiales bacterium]|jgi:hemolysin III|nr:hemolysin III family protein [Chlorobiales bacterium]
MKDDPSANTASDHKRYSPKEEIANSLTHGAGVALSIVGFISLISQPGTTDDMWRIIAFSIYGSALVLLYLASTLYHSVQKPALKYFFRVIDHASIYLLIAGTYTPFLLVSMRNTWGWTLFILIWAIAILGVCFTTIFIRRFRKLSVATYVIMGWLAVLSLHELLTSIPSIGIVWLAVGGIVYTLGVVFYMWHKLPYHHAIWHIFVLAGSACHYLAICTI